MQSKEWGKSLRRRQQGTGQTLRVVRSFTDLKSDGTYQCRHPQGALLRPLMTSPDKWKFLLQAFRNRASFIWVSNPKACAGEPQSCSVEDKCPGVVVMQPCIFHGLCCVESTTHESGKSETIFEGTNEITFFHCYKGQTISNFWRSESSFVPGFRQSLIPQGKYFLIFTDTH